MGLFRSKTPPPETRSATRPPRRLRRWLRRWALRLFLMAVVVILLLSIFNPPTTWTILREGSPGRRWVQMDAISPHLARAVVAAEDANFCRHWGFDMAEIRKVVASGSARGASTISQQVAKNVFLWQGRSWPRKVLEAGLTPLVEALWTKRRILEVYLNVAEFGPGIFGAAQAADRIFGVTADKLTPAQAARLAAVLPAPKSRDPRGKDVARRAGAIADGAATIARDGRDACFVPSGGR